MKLKYIFFTTVLAIIASLIAFEIFLRFSIFGYKISHLEYLNYDSKVGRWHKKDFSAYFTKECYKTYYSFDKKGLIKSIYKYKASKKDVVILGDSQVEALMVKNQNIIHNTLAKEYSNKYNFLNYGIRDSSQVQNFIIIKEKANLQNTKYILDFINLPNDIKDSESNYPNITTFPRVFVKFKSLSEYKIIPPRQRTKIDKIKDFLRNNFQIYQFIGRGFYYVKHKNTKNDNQNDTNKSQENTKLDFSKSWINLKGAIYQSNLLALKHNIKYKAIIYSTNNDKKDIQILSDFLQKHSIAFVVLNNQNEFELKGFSCDDHWNDETHINIAKYLKNIDFLD